MGFGCGGQILPMLPWSRDLTYSVCGGAECVSGWCAVLLWWLWGGFDCGDGSLPIWCVSVPVNGNSRTPFRICGNCSDYVCFAWIYTIFLIIGG